ncbi:MAG TPA: C45 family autoproteolytic acyltransferase/hydrolase [Kofleriaceae bacterium]
MKPFLMARLAGTQTEMGAQHGALVADEAAKLIEFYNTMPERALAGDMGGLGRRVVRTIARAWQARLVRDRPPELAARSRAFADAVRAALPGIAVPSDAMLDIATMDALQNCVGLVGRAKLGPFAEASPFGKLGAKLGRRVTRAAVPACSTVIAWGAATHDGELMFGRNFDFPGVGVWDTAPAFVTCAPTGGQRYGFFATRGADAPVVTVINEAGLVFAPHTRFHAGITFGGAMIVDVVHDLARRAETLEDAIRIARERPISSSWGIAVGSAREKSACVLEIAGPAVEVVRPAAGASFLVCANRYRSAALQAGELAASEAWAFHSERRERRLRALVEERTAPLTPEVLARFLGDRRDHEAPERRRHLGAIVAQGTNVHCAVVTPARREAIVGIDQAPTCEGRWAALAWDWEGPAGAWELGRSEGSGFSAHVREDIAAPHSVAIRALHEAAQAYEQRHDVPATLAAIERAIAVEPEDPSLRLPAAWLALEAKLPDRAIVHVHAGLATETEPYRRGQLLLWGARAAQTQDRALAARWTDELARLGIAELTAASRKRFRGRPHVNLMLADAY